MWRSYEASILIDADTISWSSNSLLDVVLQPFSTRQLALIINIRPKADIGRRCHSGSCLDLPYIYSTEGKIKEPNLLAEAGQGLLGAGMSYLRSVGFHHESSMPADNAQRRYRRNDVWCNEVSTVNLESALIVLTLSSLGKQVMNSSSGARERTMQTKTSPADVIMWSGCKDSQTVCIIIL